MSSPLSPRMDKSHWSTTSSDYGADEKFAVKEKLKGSLRLPSIREEAPPPPKSKPGTPGHNGDIVITIARLLQALPVAIACAVHVASPIMALHRLRPFDIAAIALSGTSLLWVFITVFLRHMWSWWVVAMDFVVVPGWVAIYLMGRLMGFDAELGTLMDLASWASIATAVIGALVVGLQVVRFLFMRWRPHHYGLPPRKPVNRDSIISNSGDRFQPSSRLPTQSILFSPPALHRQVSGDSDWLGPIGMARSPLLPTVMKASCDVAAPTQKEAGRGGVASMRGVAAGEIRPARARMVESVGRAPRPSWWDGRGGQHGRRVAAGEMQPARSRAVESMGLTVPESLRLGKERDTMNRNRMTGSTVMSEIYGAYSNIPNEPTPPPPVPPAKNPARRLRNLTQRMSRINTGQYPRQPMAGTAEPRRQTRRQEFF